MTPLVDRRPDYDELLRLAEAAPANAVDVPSVPTAKAFHRAVSPDVVAALIRENRQQAERIAALETLLDTTSRDKHGSHWSIAAAARPYETCPAPACANVRAALAESRP